MSDRERWILYPVVALALAFAVRSHCELAQLRRVVVAERVELPQGGSLQRIRLLASEVVLQPGLQAPAYVQLLAARQGDGTLILHGAQGKPLVQLGSDANGGLLETYDRQQRKLVWLTSSNGDGAVLAVRPGDKKAMLLGHYEPLKASGLFEIEVGEQNARIVPRVGWVEVAAKKGAPSENKGPDKPGASSPGKAENRPPPTTEPLEPAAEKQEPKQDAKQTEAGR